VWDLSVTTAERGVVEGTITLTAVQIGRARERVSRERVSYYVPIHEMNRDGQLRGWLLK
jgi:hypothetical protein